MGIVLTVVSASREYLVVVSSGLLGGFSVCLVQGLRITIANPG